MLVPKKRASAAVGLWLNSSMPDCRPPRPYFAGHLQNAGSDEPPKEANQAVVAAAGAAWPTLPTIDTPVTTVTIVEETQPATDHANAVQISNGSVLTGSWSMFSYLFLVLSGVLAVVAALWLLPRMRVRAKSEVADEEELAASPYTSS